jgi:hypothetical protein
MVGSDDMENTLDSAPPPSSSGKQGVQLTTSTAADLVAFLRESRRARLVMYGMNAALIVLSLVQAWRILSLERQCAVSRVCEGIVSLR